MKVLIFGSRSLTWKHVEVFSWLAQHAMLAENEPLADFIRMWAHEPSSAHPGHAWRWLPDTEPLILLNGDGPPGRERGAIGADKLALFACMRRWDEKRRRIRWFPPEPEGEETWAQAAARRNRAMVEAGPQRVYCVHTNLDASKGSSMTADFLKAAGIPFWYVQATTAGALVGVEERR
jgi:hypothetical protein